MGFGIASNVYTPITGNWTTNNEACVLYLYSGALYQNGIKATPANSRVLTRLGFNVDVDNGILSVSKNGTEIIANYNYGTLMTGTLVHLFTAHDGSNYVHYTDLITDPALMVYAPLPGFTAGW